MLYVLFQPAKLHNIYYNVEAFPNYFLFPIIFHVFLGGFKIKNYLCTIKLLLNIKSTLLWTNYKTSKISSMSFADNE